MVEVKMTSGWNTYNDYVFDKEYYGLDFRKNYHPPADFIEIVNAFDLMHTQNGTNINRDTSEAGC